MNNTKKSFLRYKTLLLSAGLGTMFNTQCVAFLGNHPANQLSDPWNCAGHLTLSDCLSLRFDYEKNPRLTATEWRDNEPPP
jgi:hypothetical protein